MKLKTKKLAQAILISSVSLGGIMTVYADSESKKSKPNYWEKFQHDTGEKWEDTKEAFRDGWIESKLESAIIMSEHLNPFDIDIEVENNVAILGGEVRNDVIRDHASVVALSVEGIDHVENNIRINSEAKEKHSTSESKRNFSQVIKDATITARVKSDLLANGEVSGLDIDVDTYKGEVTLTGKVDSGAERVLAEYIAKDNDGIVKVINEIVVKS